MYSCEGLKEGMTIGEVWGKCGLSLIHIYTFSHLGGFTEICSEKIKQDAAVDFDGRHVLLVEDNELNLEIAKSLLEMYGLTVDLSLIHIFQAAEEQFDKMWKLVDSMTPEERNADFHFGENVKMKEAHWQRDRNIRDCLLYTSRCV